MLLGLALRIWRLGVPTIMAFDENHYVPAAMAYLNGVPDPNGLHPPLGKMLLAGFMELCWGFQRYVAGDWMPDGTSPVAWRVGSLILGLAMIAMTCALGLRLFRSRVAAVLAGFFLAIDYLHIVQSRLAMLDMYEAFFILAALWYTWRYIESEGRPRGILMMAALCYGLGTAVKWSTLFAALGGVLGVLLLKEVHGGWRARCLEAARVSAVGLGVTAAIYLLSFLPLLNAMQGDVSATAAQVAQNHRVMWEFRHSQKFTQTMMSEWWQWPILVRPILYHAWETNGEPDVAWVRAWSKTSSFHDLVGWKMTGAEDRWTYSIVGMGGFWVWYAFLLFLLVALVRCVVAVVGVRGGGDEEWRRAWERGGEKGVVFCVLAYVCQLVMWSLNRGFIFYMLPMTPFMALLVGEALAGWLSLRPGRFMIGVFVLISLFNLVLYWPLLVGFPLPLPWSHELLLYKNGLPWGGWMAH